MKETLYTIPLTDAFLANDECPFCYVSRNIEQDLLDLVLGSGSSYMESDMRDKTDKAGFCRAHFQKMFDYGNTLGNAWILKTHFVRMQDEFDRQIPTISEDELEENTALVEDMINAQNGNTEQNNQQSSTSSSSIAFNSIFPHGVLLKSSFNCSSILNISIFSFNHFLGYGLELI